jgi:hypothetical protein
MTTRLTKLAFATLTAAAMTSVTVASVSAQDRPPLAVEVAAGSLLFPDNVVNESFGGGNLRAYVSPGLSVGPEVSFIRGERHSHLMLTGNLTYDVLDSRQRHVIPFLLIGGGLFQTREKFADATFTATEGAFTAGGGLRAHLGDRITAGFETRVGWELHARINGFIGVRLR